MNTTALITGIAGQDGSFLAELLLTKGHEVHGIVRRSSSLNTDRIYHLYEDQHESNTRLHPHYGDLGDSTSLVTIVRQVEPDEMYHLGALWLMLQQDEPDDYVIATGEAHSVRELCELAFGHLHLDWQDHVRIDERYFRPSEVDNLLGDASRAAEQRGWKETVTFPALVRRMVDADLQALERGGTGPAPALRKEPA
jgi:GDP-D-mannose dehydratase